MLSHRLGRSQAAAEVRIERSTALAKAAFESAVTAMLICDAEGRILLTNPAASEIFGHTDADLQGHSLHETLIPQERLAEYRRFLRFIRATGDGGMPRSDRCRYRPNAPMARFSPPRSWCASPGLMQISG
ncbi:PAS domain-containing protein [Roseicyclus sp.]|uniref:PAS domain-containing protein n=1 Tax=Roseicyclus sp. TaxID=1914329 RepID=UPI003F6BFFA9